MQVTPLPIPAAVVYAQCRSKHVHPYCSRLGYNLSDVDLQGVGFGVTCESSSYDFSVDEADMAAKAAAIGCSSFFGYNNDTSDTNVTFCKELEKPENYQTAQFGKVKVFAVGFENGGPAAGSPDKCFRPVRNADDALRDDCISSGINITTAFKNTPTCKGRAQARRCTLRQGVVEYAVMIKNDTISLRNPHWQNDTFLQDTPVNLLDMANYWWEVFPQLYPPIQVNLEHGPRSNSLVFGLYGDCLSSYRESNTSCSVAGFQTQPIVLKDLSIRYINQADPNLSECNYTWSDPMQACLTHLTFQLKLYRLPETMKLIPSFKRTCSTVCAISPSEHLSTLPLLPIDRFSSLTGMILISLLLRPTGRSESPTLAPNTARSTAPIGNTLLPPSSSAFPALSLSCPYIMAGGSSVVQYPSIQ